MPDIKIIIFEDDYSDWFGGRNIRYVFFEPNIFDLISKKFCEKIKRIEVFENEEFVIRIYRISHSNDLGKLSEQQLVKLAGLFADEVQVVNYYSKYYSPQSSRLFGLKNYYYDDIDIVKTQKPKHYEVRDNVLIVHL